MEGVTTAIVLFVFVCVLFPRLIDNRPQYYAAFVCTLLIILLDAGARIFGYSTVDSAGIEVTRQNDFWDIAYVLIALLQVAAIILLFLSAGGLTVRGLTREMAGAFEVIRRGETEKEIIIPIGDQKQPRERKRAVDTVGEPQQRYDLSTDEGEGVIYPPKKSTPPTPGPTPGPERRSDEGPIPMD